MSADKDYDRLCEILSGYERLEGERPKLAQHRGGRRRIYVGDGRFDPPRGNAALVRSDGTVALNLQLNYFNDEVCGYEIGVFWCGVASAPSALTIDFGLMYHLDVGRADWPVHPERHVQFEFKVAGHPPFGSWRIPIETCPLRIIEYLVEQIAPRRRRRA